jgi:NADH-quinone oxidoreductase subunit E
MSVRRLADDALQPASFAFTPAMEGEVAKWIGKYPAGREQSAVIPLLMLAQDQEGWVSKPAIEHVASRLGMPFIRALEVATFYTQFQLKPVGSKAHVQVCGTTPCMLRGAEELKKVCQHRIHHDPFHLNEAGTLSWEEVECQGACVNAPMVMIGHDTYEDLTPERLAEIIDAFGAGKGAEVKTGPQIDRIFSAPEGGPLTLTGIASKAKAAKAAASPEAAGKAVQSAAVAAPAVPVVAAKPAKSAAQKAAAQPPLDDKNRPAGIEKPHTVDDLKLISGVGPKIEGILHALGIYTFAQVAAWKKAEREWVDGYLKFSGRIERDDWVKQAKALAKGGVAEYVRVFGKKPR